MMSETPTSYPMRMARATEKDIEAVQNFWHELGNKIVKAAEMADEIDTDWVSRAYENVEGSFNRVFWGYQTLHDNVCDTTLSYLDFKPGLKAAPDLLAVLERWQALFPGKQIGSPSLVELIIDTRAAIAAAKGETSGNR